MWSQGIMSLPLNFPVCTWMPLTGPVAYHVQSDFFTSFVISRAADQLMPSSVEDMTKTLRVSRLVPSTICGSWSVPRFQVDRRMILPVLRSTTGAGFPQVFPGSCRTTVKADHVLPLSTERLTTRLISPASPQPGRRARSRRISPERPWDPPRGYGSATSRRGGYPCWRTENRPLSTPPLGPRRATERGDIQVMIQSRRTAPDRGTPWSSHPFRPPAGQWR